MHDVSVMIGTCTTACSKALAAAHDYLKGGEDSDLEPALTYIPQHLAQLERAQ